MRIEGTEGTGSGSAALPFAQRSELALSFALLGVLIVLLVPLPPLLLDVLLATNLGLTILLLLVTLSAQQSLDFSVFPSMLLLMTLFRLSLNVATTRSILLHAHAGKIVSTFGNFVVGGNLVIGLVIFLILIVIQFVVITKGASRISEVAARFTLDAMPGKQMAIDAEMTAGTIDESEARRRRQHLMWEAEFHGAMDGASKFVRGDAIAGLVITAINLIGGAIIGVTRDMSIGQAIRTFSVLSVGDGLVSQIPALIIATAAGILVTKATSQTSLGHEIGSQLLTNRRPLVVGAFILSAIALTPGLPKIPFLVLAGGLWIAARRIKVATARTALEKEPPPAPKTATETHINEFLQNDRACVEVGARLIPLVDPKRGSSLLDRIAALRRDLAQKNGVWVPPIRVRDNIHLDVDAYRILIGGREVSRGLLKADHWLAIDPDGTRPAIEGEVTQDPAFGLPAKWIAEGERRRAELSGYTVVDAASVLVTHLCEVVKRHAHELLGREDLKKLIDKIKETAPTVVDELVPQMLSMGALHRILTMLLEERVPITNLVRILETLAHFAPVTKDPAELAERVRMDQGRAICDRFRDDHNRLHAIVFEPRLEMDLRRAIHERNLALDPVRLEKLIVRLAHEHRKARAGNQDVAVLTDTSLRRPLWHAIVRALPDMSVVAYQEVPNNLLLEAVALIRFDEIAGPRPESAPAASAAERSAAGEPVAEMTPAFAAA
jgi:flagellar biosynthesis protein FlhA